MNSETIRLYDDESLQKILSDKKDTIKAALRDKEMRKRYDWLRRLQGDVNFLEAELAARGVSTVQ
jgi:hypothetical protein